jgi:ethanolaminephosphotransferase
MICTWEEFQTHILYLGYISGPVEGQISGCLLFLLTAATGDDRIWTSFPILKVLGSSRPLNEWAAITFIFMATVSAFGSIWNVFTRRKAAYDCITAGIKLFPSCATLVGASFWILMNDERIFRSRLNFWLFMMIIGVSFAHQVFRIITCHLCQMSFPIWSAPFFGILLILLNTYSGGRLVDTRLNLWIILLTSIVYSARLVIGTFQQFCRCLKISCFSITAPTKRQSDMLKKK